MNTVLDIAAKLLLLRSSLRHWRQYLSTVDANESPQFSQYIATTTYIALKAVGVIKARAIKDKPPKTEKTRKIVSDMSDSAFIL